MDSLSATDISDFIWSF